MVKKAVSRYARKDALLAGTIKKYQIASGYRTEEMERISGVSPRTLRRRANVPGDFRLSELRALVDQLKIPRDEIVDLIL